MTVKGPDDDRRNDVGVELEELLDLPILDPEAVVRLRDGDRDDAETHGV
jgi:hypothetical protein